MRPSRWFQGTATAISTRITFGWLSAWAVRALVRRVGREIREAISTCCIFKHRCHVMAPFSISLHWIHVPRGKSEITMHPLRSTPFSQGHCWEVRGTRGFCRRILSSQGTSGISLPDRTWRDGWSTSTNSQRISRRKLGHVTTKILKFVSDICSAGHSGHSAYSTPSGSRDLEGMFGGRSKRV